MLALLRTSPYKFKLEINLQLEITLMIKPFVSFLLLTSFLSLQTTAATAAVRNEKDEYDACIKLTKKDPELAFESALSWRDQGGGFPARHCAALALVGMKKYHLAAPRLEKLAQEMREAGSHLVLAVLSQAANTWLLAKDYSRAYGVVTAALELNSNDVDLLVDRSRILAAAENYQDAFNDLDLALRIDPTRIDAMVFRAVAWRHLGNNERAFEDVDLALSLLPDDVDGLVERGILHRLLGRPDEARKDWLKVLELTPNSPAGETARRNIEKLDVK
ncbi:tetratricopeptide repeat protein [Sneathiella sp. P13V-1]|uniref:tetratricopeptide repeat protein n=1 Tax=Sneathiella sp. P13V-1 TaxID=2697366 RepID=UPI00187BB1D7|nr:tetratricopeptide repeat protein [Sneathiella sp. P13V-1]MBE7635714.1 tetratricopeptide repeat protein [Sneathiella sp. P13V-1]